MSKRKHHYVPRFYLEVFRSAPRRIHIYNLPRHQAIPNASLRDQCYKHRFYGTTDDLEENLAIIECHVAPVLKAIREQRVLPSPESEEYQLLFAFVALQLLRTTAAAARINTSVDKMTKQVFSRDPRLEGIDIESVRFGYDYPVLLSLSHLPAMLYSISDLKAHLILASENSFITSDNPVCKYNQYCEAAREVGVTGALSRGLLLFLPLSPGVHLLLYDGSVYKVGDLRSNITSASDEDVELLNMMQVISASENVYFSDWQQAKGLEQLARKAARYRDSDSVRVLEYGAEKDENYSLLHLFERTPNLGLNLSFLSIRRNARRVPLYERVRNYRKPFPMPDRPGPPYLRGRTVRFSRPKGSR